MNLEKIMNNFFQNETKLEKHFRKIGLNNDNLQELIINQSMIFFQNKYYEQKQLINCIVHLLEQKNSYARKLKIISVLIQIFKITIYDLVDIITAKKMKFLHKVIKIKTQEKQLNKNTMEIHIFNELLIPLHNYLMKLSCNEQLYNTFQSGQIPFDDIYRRGSKVRFIWIFKAYNLLNLILPIISSLIKFIQCFPKFLFFIQLASLLYKDLILINNYIILALQQTIQDNYMLMPYFDLMQFNQSLKEQTNTSQSINKIYQYLHPKDKKIIKPKILQITAKEMEDIETQALRVKLISVTLKSPKKDFLRLETEYNDRSQNKKDYKNCKTEGNDINENEEKDIIEKYQKFQ